MSLAAHPHTAMAVRFTETRDNGPESTRLGELLTLNCVTQPPDALQSACTHSSTSTWLTFTRRRDCSYSTVVGGGRVENRDDQRKYRQQLKPLIIWMTEESQAMKKRKGSIGILMVVRNMLTGPESEQTESCCEKKRSDKKLLSSSLQLPSVSFDI